MISETGKKGFTLLEVLIVLLITALLVIPTTFVYRRNYQAALLGKAASEILSAMEAAHQYALSERKIFTVVFRNNRFAVYRQGTQLIGKERKFPSYILVKEKTSGFQPATFLPDGTAQQAGHLILIDKRTKKEKKLILYNITGKCIVEENK